MLFVLICYIMALPLSLAALVHSERSITDCSLRRKFMNDIRLTNGFQYTYYGTCECSILKHITRAATEACYYASCAMEVRQGQVRL